MGAERELLLLVQAGDAVVVQAGDAVVVQAGDAVVVVTIVVEAFGVEKDGTQPPARRGRRESPGHCVLRSYGVASPVEPERAATERHGKQMERRLVSRVLRARCWRHDTT